MKYGKPVRVVWTVKLIIMWGDVIFTGKAYCKIILHAAKYPHCSVNGVLLAETSKLKANKLVLVDTIPLFHVQLNLTPMAEIALSQIDHWAASQGLSIAGYYTANENWKECSIEKAAGHRVAEKIAENTPAACLVVVDNWHLSLHLDNLAIRVGQYSSSSVGQYGPIGFKCRSVEMQKVTVDPVCVVDACAALLQRQAYKTLIDFDNHLDDISGDWTNTQINDDIVDILKLYGSLGSC